MELNARKNAAEFQAWIGVGWDKTLLSYAPFNSDHGKLSDIPESHWHFLESSLLPYYETDSHLIVHTNACPEFALAEQPDFMIFEEQFNAPPIHVSGKIIMYGHTSQKSGLPKTNGNAICIDTWAYGAG